MIIGSCWTCNEDGHHMSQCKVPASKIYCHDCQVSGHHNTGSQICIHWKPGSRTASRNTSPANISGSGSGQNTPDSGKNTPLRRSSLIPPRSPLPRASTPSQVSHLQSPIVRSKQVDLEDKKDEASLLDEDLHDTIATSNLITVGLVHKQEIQDDRRRYDGPMQ